MWWLWIVGPIAVAIIYLLTGGRPPRRVAEIERWRKRMTRAEHRSVKVQMEPAEGYRGSKEVRSETKTERTRPGPRRVRQLPQALARMLATTAGGEVVGFYELVPKLAYLAVMGADAFQGSDHATVVALLDESAPSFTVRPLPIVEGQRVPNDGVQFKKDEEFMELFLVERSVEAGPSTEPTEENDKAIRKWISPPIREALLELPNGWLRVDGKAKTMAFTLYGTADADRIGELVAAADVVFAEYGAEGGPSLLGDEGDDDGEPAAAPPPSKKKAAGQRSAAAQKN